MKFQKKYFFLFLIIFAIGSCKKGLKLDDLKDGLSEDVSITKVDPNSCRVDHSGPRFQEKSLLVCHFEKLNSQEIPKIVDTFIIEKISVKHSETWIFDQGDQRFCMSFQPIEKYDDHGNKYFEMAVKTVDGKIHSDSTCKANPDSNEISQQNSYENLENLNDTKKFYRLRDGNQVEHSVNYQVRNSGQFPKSTLEIEEICKATL